MKTKLLRKLRHKFLKNYTLNVVGRLIAVKCESSVLNTFTHETPLEEIDDYIRRCVRWDIESYCLSKHIENRQKRFYLW